MKQTVIFLITAIFFVNNLRAQEKISNSTYLAVSKLPDSISINNGQLKLFNLFKLQVKAIYENQNKQQGLFRAAVIEKTYKPFNEFWSGYVGDSSVYFDEIILPLLKDSIKLIENKSSLYSNGNIDKYFKQMALKMQSKTGYSPKGKWYLAFGSGVTDLGGFGGGVMVLDLTHYKTTLDYTKFILPHELTHQIFDFTNKEDTSAKGLYRIINEGFAVFMNEKLIGDRYKLNDYLQYTKEELDYCIQNEANIMKKLKPFLFTNNSDHSMALADRGQKIFKDGPGAIGYFLGYQICKSYVMKNGEESWKDIFTMAVKTIFEKSGYDPK